MIDRALNVEFAGLPTVLLAALGDVIPVLLSGYYEVDPRVPKILFVVHPADFDYPDELRQRIRRAPSRPPPRRAPYATGIDGVVRISDLMSQDEYRRPPIYRDLHAAARNRTPDGLPTPRPGAAPTRRGAVEVGS